MKEGNMSLHFGSLLLFMSVTYASDGEGVADDQSTEKARQSVKEVVAQFEKGDPGWRVRMQALVATTTAGAGAVGVLVESLQRDEPSVREFAAHALSIIADPRSESALKRALDDPDRGVRIYAIRALSGLGKLKLTDEYRQAMQAASSAWPKA